MFFSYPAKFKLCKDGRYLVTFRDLQRVATDSETLEDAIREAIDALSTDMHMRMRFQEVLPLPSAIRRGEIMIPVSLHLVPRLAKYWAQALGHSNVALVVEHLMAAERSKKGKKS